MRLLPLLLAVPLVACASSGDVSSSTDDALTSLTEAAVQGDLDYLGAQLRQLYAPLATKQAAGFDLDAALATARAEVHAATDDAGRFGALHAFVAKLRDAGVTMADRTFHGEDATDASMRITLRAAEGKFVLGAAVQPAKAGDALVAIDGVPVADLVGALTPYAGVSVPELQASVIASMLARRPFWLPEALRPKSATAHVELVRADGTAVALDVPWGRMATVDTTVAAALATPAPESGSAAAPTTPEPPSADPPPPVFDPLALGYLQPEWWTPTVAAQLGPKVVAPTDAGLAALAPEIASFEWSYNGAPHAVRFQTGEKAAIVVRFSTLRLGEEEATFAIDWLATLLQEQKPDAVVLDLTGISGGTQLYIGGIASLFLTAPIEVGSLAYRADRQNLAALLSATQRSVSHEAGAFYIDTALDLERAFDEGRMLGKPVPFPGLTLGTGVTVGQGQMYGAKTLAPNPRSTFTGPVLVLQNERTNNMPEMLSLMLQQGGAAKTFGTATAGAAGVLGSVELPASRTQVWFPRSVLSVGATAFQDRGVSPDFPRARQITDVTVGQTPYALDFLKAAFSFTR